MKLTSDYKGIFLKYSLFTKNNIDSIICNATIAHTREIILYNRYTKDCSRHRKYYLNNISYTILSMRIELARIENRYVTFCMDRK